MENSMKKVTLIIWLIIFGFIALVIFQNQTFFMAKESYRINFGIMDEYMSPPIAHAALILIFFFSGLIIAYLFGFSARFKAKRTIKRLNHNITTQTTEMTKLKDEISNLKGIQESADLQADTIKLDMSTTQKISDDSTAETDAKKTESIDTVAATDNPKADNEQISEDKKE